MLRHALQLKNQESGRHRPIKCTAKPKGKTALMQFSDEKQVPPIYPFRLLPYPQGDFDINNTGSPHAFFYSFFSVHQALKFKHLSRLIVMALFSSSVAPPIEGQRGRKN